MDNFLNDLLVDNHKKGQLINFHLLEQKYSNSSIVEKYAQNLAQILKWKKLQDIS
jgi:hypothetical protein